MWFIEILSPPQARMHTHMQSLTNNGLFSNVHNTGLVEAMQLPYLGRHCGKALIQGKGLIMHRDRSSHPSIHVISWARVSGFAAAFLR